VTVGDEAKPGRVERPRKKHGLQTLMLVVIYCALTFQIARPAAESWTPDTIAPLAAWLGLGLAGLGVLALTRASDFAYRGLAAIAIALGVLVACVAALGVFGAFVAIALLGAVVASLILGEKADSESLLWTMAIAARHGMPLAGVVSAFARQSGHRGRNRGLALAGRLEEGIPLPQAMRMSGALIPEEGVLAAAIGLETNTLAVSLGEAAARLAGRREVIGPVVRRLVYLAVILSIVQSMVGFLVYFILPKMEAIMRDFDIPMSGWSQTVFIGGYWIGLGLMTGPGPAILIPIVIEIGMFLLVVAWFYRLLGWKPMDSWLFGWFNPGRHSVVLMRALAIGIEGGRPIRETIQVLQRWYPPKGARRRLAGVVQGLERGGDWVSLLRTTRFLRQVDCAVLESAARAGNVPWALRTLAGQRERSFIYRLEFWTQVLFPLAILAIGAGILSLGLICYEPMSQLMEALSKP
jgi:type II secretory pathway component PulF